MNAPPYRLPPMREEVLRNGLRVIWIPDVEQATITIALQLPFGKLNDPAGFEGVTEVVLGLMQKGTGATPYDVFTERFEHSGSSLFSEVGDEFVVLGCKLLTSHAHDIIPCFWEMIISPAMRHTELKRLKREFITGIKAESTEPGGIANRHLHAMLFGGNHPAGRVHSEKSVGRITTGLIADYLQTHVVPHNATIVVAGDFDRKIADTWGLLFASWKSRGDGPPAIPGTAPLLSPQRQIRFIEKPDLTQSTILMGMCVPGELYNKRGELALANYILGGGNFSSRLMSHVRSQLGKTYSISSHLSTLRQFGIFTIGTATQNAQVGGMIESILDVCGRFHGDGVGADEVDKAKQFVLGNMAFQFEGIGNVAEKVLWLRFHGRNNTYVDRYGEMIGKISVDDINSEINGHFDPQRLIITVVGRKDEVLPQLSRLGTVEVRHFRSISPT